MEDMKSLTVKEWADEDRPREKMLTEGKKHLSNAELIAILIRTGLPGKNAVEVAKEILAANGNSLTALSRLDFKQLQSIRGMALAKSATLMAALELGWRMQSEINEGNILVINDSKSCFNLMARRIADLDHEEFWVIHLSNSNKVLAQQRVSMGGQTDTSVDVRIILRGALENKAVKIMLVHNHPSGYLRPSHDDFTLTRHIKEAANLLEIKVIDHLIIGIETSGNASYFSFHDNGVL